ncbi:MAG: bifunctional oligoribonuclease/PAP phosphatase NrnA [Bacteroidales bacterium]|nr:bifunctional oligoribonuclease/PAP phosphatase NrnA [Bacteroidales bacterium]
MIDLSKYTKQLSEYFLAPGNILLICHINPDGDAIGSQLALYHYLKSMGRSVDMISPNNLQEFLRWMDGAGEIRIFTKERTLCRDIISRAGVIVLLDFNNTGRMGEAEEYVKKSAAAKVIIDHHLDPSDFGDLLISDPGVCSTAELVHRIVTAVNGSRFINKAYAEALYVGIVTDTGNFEHGAYGPDTFRTVADILESGIDRDRILDLVYNNFSADRLRLQGYVLATKMIVLPEYRTAYMTLTRDELKRFNHVKGDTEGFVNMPLSVKGVVFSALFIEKEGFVKLSFRSKGKIPTNEFATRYFNGGGHLNASGGEWKAGLDETVTRFLDALDEFRELRQD